MLLPIFRQRFKLLLRQAIGLLASNWRCSQGQHHHQAAQGIIANHVAAECDVTPKAEPGSATLSVREVQHTQIKIHKNLFIHLYIIYMCVCIYTTFHSIPFHYFHFIRLDYLKFSNSMITLHYIDSIHYIDDIHYIHYIGFIHYIHTYLPTYLPTNIPTYTYMHVCHVIFSFHFADPTLQPLTLEQPLHKGQHGCVCFPCQLHRHASKTDFQPTIHLPQTGTHKHLFPAKYFANFERRTQNQKRKTIDRIFFVFQKKIEYCFKPC